MIKSINLGLAILYSILLLYLSFANLDQIPKVEVNQIDKFYHLVAYFILAVLWLFYFRNQKQSIFYNCVITLIVLGCLIEFLQNRINPSRAFEYADMISNVFGIILGTITVKLWIKVKSTA